MRRVCREIYCFAGIITKVGPGLSEGLSKQVDEEEAMYKSIRQSEIDSLKESIALENTAQVSDRPRGYGCK